MSDEDQFHSILEGMGGDFGDKDPTDLTKGHLETPVGVGTNFVSWINWNRGIKPTPETATLNYFLREWHPTWPFEVISLTVDYARSLQFVQYWDDETTDCYWLQLDGNIEALRELDQFLHVNNSNNHIVWDSVVSADELHLLLKYYVPHGRPKVRRRRGAIESYFVTTGTFIFTRDITLLSDGRHDYGSVRVCFK